MATIHYGSGDPLRSAAIISNVAIALRQRLGSISLSLGLPLKKGELLKLGQDVSWCQSLIEVLESVALELKAGPQ